MPDTRDRFSKEAIQALLMRQDNIGMHAIGRALIAINKRQTSVERSHKEVLRRNGRGFTPVDAELGTSMAEFYAARQFLTPKQLAYWRKENVAGIPRICKYWKQLQEDAKMKHGIKPDNNQQLSLDNELDRN